MESSITIKFGCTGKRLLRSICSALVSIAPMVAAETAYSQATLSSVARQAARNSERVKVAESDLAKAKDCRTDRD
jgi:hypothetical protein